MIFRFGCRRTAPFRDEPVRSARGVEQEVGGERWDAGDAGAGQRGRVDEHDRVSPVEFGQQRLVGRRAEVVPVGVGEQDHARGTQGVERVRRPPRARRRRRVGAASRRTRSGPGDRARPAPRIRSPRAPSHRATGSCALPGSRCTPGVETDRTARRDVVLVHHAQCVLDGPLRQRRVRRRPQRPRRAASRHTRAGDVLVDVDSPVPHACDRLLGAYRSISNGVNSTGCARSGVRPLLPFRPTGARD